MKKTSLILILAVFLVIFSHTSGVFSAQGAEETLVTLINNVRVNNRLSALAENDALNQTAQQQAEYLAAEYGANFGTVSDWHSGPNSRDAYDRADAAGYDLKPGWTVTEIAFGGSDASTTTDAYRGWLDSQVDSNAIFNADALEIGAGIASGDGFTYYVVVFGIELGSGASANEGVISTLPKGAVTPQVAPVSVATPNEDGSVFHTVESGQALWSIAIAYDITIDQILALNGLDANAIIFEGQTLQVHAAFTPTPQPTMTNTPLPPTRTPIPAQTARAVNTPAATAQPDDTGGLFAMDNQTLGLVLVLISGIGLVMIVAGNYAKGKASKQEKKDE